MLTEYAERAMRKTHYVEQAATRGQGKPDFDD
jgi:hypothetical protein